MSLRRLRNLILIVAPYAVTAPLALAVADRLDTSAAAGALALALVPAPLIAPAIVRVAGGRSDTAGALVTGTCLVSFALLVLRGGLAQAGALAGAQAYVAAALVAGAAPPLRDRLAPPLLWAADIALLGILALAIASGPRIDAVAGALAFASLGLTATVSALLAFAMRRDALSVVAGAGTRDPGLAVALAWALGGPSATGAPLVYGAAVAVLAALAVRRR